MARSAVIVRLNLTLFRRESEPIRLCADAEAVVAAEK